MAQNRTPLTEEQRRLVEDNLGLAYMVAKRMTRLRLDDDERESAALEGLCRAARRYDETRDEKFSTYAVKSITCYVIRAADLESRTIRIPVWLRGARGKLDRRKTGDCQAAAARVLAMMRKQVDKVTAPCAIRSPYEIASDREQDARLHAAVGTLPEHIRVMVSAHLSGLTNVEAAKRLGITDKGAGYRLARGITLLREALAEKEVAA